MDGPPNIPNPAREDPQPAREAEPCVSQADRDGITHVGLRYIAAFVAVGYALITIGHGFVLPAPVFSILGPMSAASAIIAAAIYLMHRRGLIPVTRANLCASLLGFLVIANSAAHVIVTGEAHQSVNLGLTIMLLGLTHLSATHLAASYLAIAAIWVLAILPGFDPGAQVHYSYFLFNSTLAGLASFMIRRVAFDRATRARKQAEQRGEELRAALHRARLAEEAVKESQAQRAFLANMSHELRTPLNAIIGFSDIMRKEQFGPLENDYYKEYAADINESGKHLLRIINDVLDLSRLHHHETEIDEAPVDIHALAQRMESLIGPRARERGVGLTISVAPRAQLVTTDATRLMQALVHILNNAVKFTPEGGHVTFEASAEDPLPGLGPETGSICFRVSDTGIGMSRDAIEQALQPFWQVENVHARQHGGMGLGLPLAKGFAELLGGRLDIDSVPGEGTRVTLRLPLWKLATEDAAQRLTA